MTSQTFDALVIGAGIVGAACADSLSREGLRVAIVDRDLIAAGATAAAMGHIVVLDDSEAQFVLTRFSQQLWKELRPELPSSVEYQQSGTLWIAADDEEMAEVVRKYRFYNARDVPAQIVDSDALAELEPNLRMGMAGALLVPEDAVIQPPCAARFLIERSQARGAQMFLGANVSRIQNDSVFFDDGSRLSAAAIVNATGVSAPNLTPGLDITPSKGHLAITESYPGFIHHQLVELGYLKSAHSLTGDSFAFNVQPRSSGQMLIGSSRQYGVESKEVEHEILSRMLERAREYMPNLAHASTLRTWTGLRAATRDKLPLIGPWPENPKLLLAAGHEGLGITTSLGTAALIADHVMQRISSIPMEPYLPARVLLDHSHA